MPLLIFLLFLLVPIAELYVIIQVGQAIGALPTIGLLILSSFVGTALMRSQGRAVWRRFGATVAAGSVPAREVVDGVLVMIGGALLLAPGFITDVVGILLLAPPTRALLRRGLLRGVTARLLAGFAGAAAGRARRPRARDYDVEGTAHDVDNGPHRLSG
jgi:UPF0716 protein FxsA